MIKCRYRTWISKLSLFFYINVRRWWTAVIFPKTVLKRAKGLTLKPIFKTNAVEQVLNALYLTHWDQYSLKILRNEFKNSFMCTTLTRFFVCIKRNVMDIRKANILNIYLISVWYVCWQITNLLFTMHVSLHIFNIRCTTTV